MPKRKCKFTDDMKKDFPFLKQAHIGSDREVLCSQCGSTFSVSHGGRSDIKDHLQTAKHKAALAAVASTSSVANFFKKTEPDDKALVVAAKEATFAYHTAVHGLSFKTSDCSSKLVTKFFEPKFGLARTKCEAVILNVISPMCSEELHEELSTSRFVCVTIDASNRKEIKVVPVIVRYFLPHEGVKVKLLDFKSVPGETSEILADHLLSVLKQHDLVEKVVGFCGDNCNTNFGGVKRRGEKNVFFKLKQEIGRNLVGIGCAAHIVHNCLQNAVDVLPVDIECLVVKIYKYFYIYTVRVTQLKEFCDFAEVEYKRILQHGNTRFLSLLPALERILNIFEGLKSYFNSQEQCPAIIKRFFEEPSQEVYLWFVHGQLHLFSKTILKMERQDICATDVASELDLLKMNVKERKDNSFIPQGAKVLLRKSEESGEISVNSVREIKNEISAFYDRCLAYISLWEKSFEDVESHKWVTKGEVTWSEVEKTAECINNKYEKAVVDLDSLFDEVVVAKHYMSDPTRKKNWEETQVTSEVKWVEMFKNFSENSISVTNLKHVIEFIFSLPGTSAPVERVFSIMNNVWSQDRSCMSESTVKALISCKMNINLTCSQFFDKIKSNSKMLKKVISTEKYEWAKKE